MAGSERDAESAALRDETQRIWNVNATFWDSHVGEGHTLHKVLVEPAVENWDRDGVVGYTYAAKVTRYRGLQPAKGFGILGQPEPHHYFHRPLRVLLGAGFRTGLVMDGIEEPAFPPSVEPRRPGAIAWENYTEIPPVLAVRLRPRAQRAAGLSPRECGTACFDGAARQTYGDQGRGNGLL